jgi:MFS family permease
VKTFAAGSGAFGALSSMLAIGSVTGALFAARREKPRLVLLLAGAAIFGLGLTVSALMPTYLLFGISLVLVGWSAQTFNTTANSSVQLLTEPVMRGRVMAVYMAIAMGCTPLGAPLVGWVADTYGPRWSIAVGASAGFLATLLGMAYLVRYRGLALKWDRGLPRLFLRFGEPAGHASRAEYRAPDPQTK